MKIKLPIVENCVYFHPHGVSKEYWATFRPLIKGLTFCR